MRPKAAWLRLETDPAAEFDHFLAAKLGMTVARLRDELSNQEWVEWSVYYGRLAQQQQLAHGKG